MLQPGAYNVHRLCPLRRFRYDGGKKERNTVFYVIAYKNEVLIFHNMIWIVLK